MSRTNAESQEFGPGHHASWQDAFGEETRARSREVQTIRHLLAEGAMVRSDRIAQALSQPYNDAACEPTHKWKKTGEVVRFGHRASIQADRLYPVSAHDECDCGLMACHPVHGEWKGRLRGRS